MPNLASGDVLLYTLRYEFFGSTYLNTFHLEYLDTLGAVDDETAFFGAYLTQAEAVNQLIDDLRDITSDSLNFVDHRLQKIRAARHAPLVSQLSLAGTIAGDAMPGNVAMVATKRSDLATRYGIGSWHQPGMPYASATTPADWDSAAMAGLSTALNNWFNLGRTPPGMVGVVWPTLWNATTPLRKTRITTITVQPTIRVMRRRTKGVGI